MRCKNFFCCCCSRCREFLFPHSCAPSHTFSTPSESSLFTREVKRVPCVINKASHMKFYVWRYNNPAAAAFVFMCMHSLHTFAHMRVSGLAALHMMISNVVTANVKRLKMGEYDDALWLHTQMQTQKSVRNKREKLLQFLLFYAAADAHIQIQRTIIFIILRCSRIRSKCCRECRNESQWK